MVQNWFKFKENGWCFLNTDDIHYDWINEATKQIAVKFSQKLIDNKDLRSGSTWFVGTNFLENNSDGKIGSKPLSKKIVSNILSYFGTNINYWDKGQVSICWSGYPKKDVFEKEKSFNFRIKKFASHIDGIIPLGAKKRRFAKEFHAFILGFPIMNNNKNHAPLVVWEGSHKIFRNFFKNIFEGISRDKISVVDITELYNECRNKVFKNCNAKQIIPNFKQPYLLDRHLLHGIDQWKDQNIGTSGFKHKIPLNQFSAGRIVIYFRPTFSDPYNWIYY